jgi:hypothetical protein
LSDLTFVNDKPILTGKFHLTRLFDSNQGEEGIMKDDEKKTLMANAVYLKTYIEMLPFMADFAGLATALESAVVAFGNTLSGKSKPDIEPEQSSAEFFNDGVASVADDIMAQMSQLNFSELLEPYIEMVGETGFKKAAETVQSLKQLVPNLQPLTESLNKDSCLAYMAMEKSESEEGILLRKFIEYFDEFLTRLNADLNG